ncbi:MAG: hypothetical protein GY941_11955 [Planctomycetes bacterium]|nr:hypothetical protein [Planctomycetota bacterium]
MKSRKRKINKLIYFAFFITTAIIFTASSSLADTSPSIAIIYFVASATVLGVRVMRGDTYA